MRARGHDNGRYLSLACNEFVYVKKDLPKRYDASFIGMWHPHREWLVKRLRRSGIDVRTWGTGWGRYQTAGWANGRISVETAVDTINSTKVNLNLSNETSWDLRYLGSSPRAVVNTLRSRKRFAPVNLRVFEINCCGGFQIMPYMDGLAARYAIGSELVVFQDPDHLVELVHYYLAHDDEREEIARRGRERSLRDHTMTMRFEHLFASIDLVTPMLAVRGTSELESELARTCKASSSERE